MQRWRVSNAYGRSCYYENTFITKLLTFDDLQKTQMAAPLASTLVTEAQLPIMYSKAGGGLSNIGNQSVVDLKN